MPAPGVIEVVRAPVRGKQRHIECVVPVRGDRAVVKMAVPPSSPRPSAIQTVVNNSRHSVRAFDENCGIRNVSAVVTDGGTAREPRIRRFACDLAVDAQVVLPSPGLAAPVLGRDHSALAVPNRLVAGVLLRPERCVNRVWMCNRVVVAGSTPIAAVE